MRTGAPLVLITVDTEEDTWGDYGCRTPGTTNIHALPALQRLCDRFGAVPTYLVNWPVVDGASSSAILRDLSSHGCCEVGTHIHPWNTPPVEEQTGPRTSMLSNLPHALIRRKLTGLHEKIQERLGCSPTSFRAGRWGFGPRVAETLLDLGYVVDSSVSPYIDWRADFGPDYRNAPIRAYRFHPEAPLVPDPAGALVEIPATIGFLGGRPRFGMRLREWALRPLPRRLRMVGIVDRLGIAAQRWLSPEVSTGGEMVRLARVLVGAGAEYLNLTFHSPTLSAGLTPFVRDARQVREFNSRIEQFLEYAGAAGFRFASLARAPHLLGLAP
jgi:hypothetical protein